MERVPTHQLVSKSTITHETDVSNAGDVLETYNECTIWLFVDESLPVLSETFVSKVTEEVLQLLLLRIEFISWLGR